MINLYKSLEEEEQRKEFMEVESMEVNAVSSALKDCKIKNHIKQFNPDGCSEGEDVFNDVVKLETSADKETVTSDVLEDHAEYLDETLFDEEEGFQPKLELQPDENANRRIKGDIIQGSLQGNVTYFLCWLIRIGSYGFKCKERVQISSHGIKIMAPSLKNKSDVLLQIQLNEVVRGSVHYGMELRVIFLYTQLKCADYIRKALGMSEESGLYYDPGSKYDPYQRIILFPGKVFEEAKVVLQSLFGELLTEMTFKEADEILIRSYVSIRNIPVTNTTTKSASFSIASGTKCSNPAELSLIPIDPPDQGGVPITTEAHTRLAQDHGGDGSNGEIIQGSLQGMGTSLRCRSVKIGLYNYALNEKVHISSNGIKIVVKNRCKGVALKIQLKEVVGISVQYLKSLLVIFLDIQFECGAYISRALEISEESGLYSDPGSKHDPYQRIILFPEEISQEAKVVLHSLFGKLLDKLSLKKANEILVRAYCQKEIKPVLNFTKRSTKKPSILSGTKCSNPAEIKRISICTPDKGGTPTTTEAHTRLGQDHGGDGSRKEIIQGSLQGVVTSLSCYTVTIGSYRYTPKQKVHISSEGIKIVALCGNKNEFRAVELKIQLKEVLQILVHYGKGLPIIFLSTQFKCSAYTRRALEMSKDSGLYYDPGSKHDPYKRITLFLENVSEEAKVVLQSLFGERLSELTMRETNEILLKTFCPEDIKKITTRSASTSIASGTKCSNRAEISRIPNDPSDKGGVTITSEAHTRLPHYHGGDKRIKGEIIQGSLQGNVTYFSCWMIRIGSYGFKCKERVQISSHGIKIMAPSLKNKSDVLLQIQLNEVVRGSVHYGMELRVIFLYTQLKCADYIKKALGMSKESEPYYDPGSKYDPYQRIILFPGKVFKKAKVVLQSLFGELLTEMTYREADEILIRSYVPLRNTSITSMTTRSASNYIPSGTKCSNPAEMRRIPINPPDKEEEKSENTDDVNADYVNTDDVTTYFIKTEERFEDSASVGEEEKSENTDDVNTNYVKTDDVTTYFIKTEERFEDNASVGEEEKSENTGDVNADYVNTDDVTNYFIKTEERFEDNASVGEEDQHEVYIKSEKTYNDANADEVTTGVKVEVCIEYGAANEGDELEPRPETPHRNNSSGVPISCMESFPDKLSNSNLTGTQAAASWRVWKMQCSKDFGNIEEAKKFCKLSYRDLYESLSLWDKVEEAQVIKKELPLDPVYAVGSFKLIGDKLLGVATIQTNLLKGETRYFDTIMYFDSDSLELISQETYPFQFDQYDENDKLIVLFEQRIKLHVVIKSNKYSFIYDIKKQYDYDVLSDNDIFFVNTNSVVCTARLKVVDGAETMETEKLTLAKMFPRSYYVVAFARVNEKVVNILVDSGTKLLIYCCELKNLDICGEIDHSSQFSVISKLREFGFNWCNPYVFRTLRSSVFTTIHQMSFTESVSPRNHVALVCTSKRSVNIFKRPYLDNGELNFSKIRPSKINKIVNAKLVIEQLDVVEILNGHRIFVRAGYNIFVIDLIHEQNRRATKRRAATGTSTAKKARSENKQ